MPYQEALHVNDGGPPKQVQRAQAAEGVRPVRFGARHAAQTAFVRLAPAREAPESAPSRRCEPHGVESSRCAAVALVPRDPLGGAVKEPVHLKIAHPGDQRRAVRRPITNHAATRHARRRPFSITGN